MRDNDKPGWLARNESTLFALLMLLVVGGFLLPFVVWVWMDTLK